MPFTILADPHTQSRQTLRVWGFLCYNTIKDY